MLSVEEKIEWPVQLDIEEQSDSEGSSVIFMFCYLLVVGLGVVATLQTIFMDRADQNEMQAEVPQW